MIISQEKPKYSAAGIRSGDVWLRHVMPCCHSVHPFLTLIVSAQDRLYLFVATLYHNGFHHLIPSHV